MIYVFYIGFVTYHEMRNPPANPIEISVTAWKWNWSFEYENGRKNDYIIDENLKPSAQQESEALFNQWLGGKPSPSPEQAEQERRSIPVMTVPLGKPVRLIMRSNDVIHSFFVPAMRVKEDVVGNRYSYLWFTPTKLGEFPIFCTEYCGREHSIMRGRLRVVTPEEFNDFLNKRGDQYVELAPADAGKQLYKNKACNACHSLDGSALVGPSFKGLYGAQRQFADGSSAVADENYIQESIWYPNKKIVAGYAAAMPAFEGQLSADDVDDIIAFIKTLK